MFTCPICGRHDCCDYIHELRAKVMSYRRLLTGDNMPSEYAYCPECLCSWPGIAPEKHKRGCQSSPAARARRMDHGVFEWTGDGVYPRARAIRVFKRKCDAEREAERLNKVREVYVVRPLARVDASRE